jgi:hypothetical protein
VILGTFNAADICWYPSTDLCLDTILWTIPSNSWLGFLLSHVLSTVGPYIDRCVSFLIMSKQLNLPQVESNQVVDEGGKNNIIHFRIRM